MRGWRKSVFSKIVLQVKSYNFSSKRFSLSWNKEKSLLCSVHIPSNCIPIFHNSKIDKQTHDYIENAKHFLELLLQLNFISNLVLLVTHNTRLKYGQKKHWTMRNVRTLIGFRSLKQRQQPRIKIKYKNTPHTKSKMK